MTLAPADDAFGPLTCAGQINVGILCLGVSGMDARWGNIRTWPTWRQSDFLVGSSTLGVEASLESHDCIYVSLMHRPDWF